MQWRWLVAGTFAVIGGCRLVYLMVETADARWVDYLAHVIGAGAAAALMVALATVRPWREPLAAAMLSVIATELVITNAFIGGPGLAAASIAAALGGAYVTRRFATAAQRTPLVIALSALVITGVVLIGLEAASMFTVIDEEHLGWLPIAVGAVFAGGLVTQLVVTTARPWPCAAGTIIIGFVSSPAAANIGDVLSTVAGGAVLMCPAYFGARIAGRFIPRHAPAPDTDVPTARVRSS